MANAIPAARWAPLENSRILRYATIFLFYFAQGVPLGLFFYAIPSYMAAGGVGTAAIATVVAVSNLPWSLKLVNGFLMDRYTFLPMGRRRIWIIGSQGLMVGGMLFGAAYAPGVSEVAVLAALGFVIMAATTFQDVAINGLAIDIMTSDEQARAGGIMFGAQALGMASATAITGWLVQNSGVSAAYLACAVALGVVMLFGIAVRERVGERRLPWSHGAAHSRNLGLQITAWRPLLKQSFRAMAAPISLLLIPFMLIRSVQDGAYESALPGLTVEFLGWNTGEFTAVAASAQLVSAIFGLVIGAWAVARFGPQRILVLCLAAMAAANLSIAALTHLWSDEAAVISLVYFGAITSILNVIALVALAMRICSPQVAATQFTIYMGLGNFGRPIGAALAGFTAGAGDPVLMFAALGGIYAVAAVALAPIRVSGPAQAAPVSDIPLGAVLPPRQD